MCLLYGGFCGVVVWFWLMFWGGYCWLLGFGLLEGVSGVGVLVQVGIWYGGFRVFCFGISVCVWYSQAFRYLGDFNAVLPDYFVAVFATCGLVVYDFGASLSCFRFDVKVINYVVCFVCLICCEFWCGLIAYCWCNVLWVFILRFWL